MMCGAAGTALPSGPYVLILKGAAAVEADPIEQVLEHLADGQQTEALEELNRLIREEPYHGGAHALRALIYADQGDLDRASDDAAIGKQLASYHPFVLYVA